MKKFTKFKLSGASKKRTTCESYVLCGVDNINKVNTKCISVAGGTSTFVVLLALLEVSKRQIEKGLMQSDKEMTKENLRWLVEEAVKEIRRQEEETSANA